METKRCTKCEKDQSLDRFYTHTVKATNARRAYTYTRPMCKGCVKIESDISYQRRKGSPIRGRISIMPPIPTREELAEWWAAGCPLNGKAA